MKRIIRLLLDRTLFAPLICLSLLASAKRLFQIRDLLKEADHIVVVPEGGFGQTIGGPDTARRLFKGENLVYIIFERSQHNTLVALLWSDIHVLFLPFRHNFSLMGLAYEWNAPGAIKEMLSRWLIRWLARRVSAEVIDLVEIFRRAAAVHFVESAAALYSQHYIVGRSHLMDTVPMAPAALPDDLRESVREQILNFARNSSIVEDAKLCCLYLRGKGENQTELGSLRRTGAAFHEYVPAIRHLIGAGYTVLLTGDRIPDERYQMEFDHRLVTAQWSGIDNRLFHLFAATAYDIWIGNVGGGIGLPCTTTVPMLTIEAFPFGVGVPNSCMYFKTVRDGDGNLVHYSELFAEHAFDYEMTGWTVCNNSSEQIEAAVSDFIDGLEQPETNDYPQRILDSLPDYILTKHVHGTLSPAWLRLFDNLDIVGN